LEALVDLLEVLNSNLVGAAEAAVVLEAMDEVLRDSMARKAKRNGWRGGVGLN
jgi:hypothetical protein